MHIWDLFQSGSASLSESAVALRGYGVTGWNRCMGTILDPDTDSDPETDKLQQQEFPWGRSSEIIGYAHPELRHLNCSAPVHWRSKKSTACLISGNW